jgi:hypothetical protein
VNGWRRRERGRPAHCTPSRAGLTRASIRFEKS